MTSLGSTTWASSSPALDVLCSGRHFLDSSSELSVMSALPFFWASWCTPCRKENPNLVRAYGLYHEKGFEIFQVSLDKTKEAWMKGIIEDGLEKWIHVSDIRYWQSVVVPLYNLEKIPSSFLLDREGKIIARDLRGDELLNTLEVVFSK